jgi:hypothetical protein
MGESGRVGGYGYAHRLVLAHLALRREGGRVNEWMCVFLSVSEWVSERVGGWWGGVGRWVDANLELLLEGSAVRPCVDLGEKLVHCVVLVRLRDDTHDLMWE